MTRDATHHRIAVGQIAHRLEVGVEASDHRHHLARDVLVRLLITRPLSGDVTEAAAHAEAVAEAFIHDRQELARGNALERFDILKHARGWGFLLPGNALQHPRYRA